jgi:hypothetical protein
MAETKKKEYISISDMFDGGGAGQSGDKFEGGGIISEIGNALGGPKIFGNKFVDRGEAPGGGTRIKHEQPVGFLTDAFDGGGFGYSGNYFSDGPYSMLANVLGVQPQGSENFVPSLRPQARPDFPFAFTSQSPVGDTSDPLAAINNPGAQSADPAPASSIPTFNDFSQLSSVKFLGPEAQMRMYDALYPRTASVADAPQHYDGSRGQMVNAWSALRTPESYGPYPGNTRNTLSDNAASIPRYGDL